MIGRNVRRMPQWSFLSRWLVPIVITDITPGISLTPSRRALQHAEGFGPANNNWPIGRRALISAAQNYRWVFRDPIGPGAPPHPTHVLFHQKDASWDNSCIILLS